MFANDKWNCTADSGPAGHGTYALRDPDALAVFTPDPADANRPPPPPGAFIAVQANHDTTQDVVAISPRAESGGREVVDKSEPTPCSRQACSPSVNLSHVIAGLFVKFAQPVLNVFLVNIRLPVVG